MRNETSVADVLPPDGQNEIATRTSITSSDIPLPCGAVLALPIASFAAGISLRVTDAMLPRLAWDFSLTLGQAAAVITVFSVAYGVAQLFFGPMGDRFGKYRVIAWGCVASAFTTIACALSPTFPMLLLTRSLAGATAAAIIPLSMAWIGDVISYDRRQIALARFMIGFIFGVSAGVFVGGFAADHLNWQVPFLGISAIFLTIGVVLLGIEKRLPSAARETRRGHGPAVARMVSEFSQVMAIPWARVVLATVFAEGAFYYGAFAFLVSHLHLGVAQK